MILLGDFSSQTLFDERSLKTLLYFYFILHTFFSAIIMLNLLVAIMATTFERVQSQGTAKSKWEYAQIIYLEGDIQFLTRIPKSEVFYPTYLYVSQPEDEFSLNKEDEYEQI